MHRFIICFMVFISIVITKDLYAASNQSDIKLFDQLFSSWTTAFNRKDSVGSCSLFSKSVVADYQGAPRKNYSSVCNGFKKLFQKTNFRYHYRYKLQHVYRSGDLAVARVTWYLDVYENGQKTSSTEDEGMDVFEKNASGQWQIINYLSYMSPIHACQWLSCY